MRSVLVVATVVALTTAAHAEIDWARGLVTAEGTGIANRAAPSPAAARGPARRMAEDAARKKLAARLPSVPIAAGSGKKLDRAAIAKLVEEAIVVTAEPETDGSWRVTMAVPTEAIRQALAGGPRAIGAADEGIPVAVVESGAKPAVGYRIGGVAAPAVFVGKDVPAWAKAAPRVKAKGAKAGEIAATLPPGAAEATLFVVVGK